MSERREINDPEVLKGLSHPLRQRLYRLLVQFGPATTSILAERIDADPGQISYHLRELGKRGFIEEAPELARDRRERWWRTTPGQTSWSALDFTTPEGRAIADAAFAQVITDQFERLQAYNQLAETWDDDWRRAVTSTNSYVRLSPDELRGLMAEWNTLVKKWGAPGRRDGSQRPDDVEDDGRESVFIFLHAFPERT
jgi:DNA-binding transcriptional ArsR family regulator